MLVCWDFRRIRTRIQDLTGFRRKEKKRTLEISAPFNFKKEGTCLPGISDDEITMLREKAAASCLGIARDHNPTGFSTLQIPPPIPARTSSLAMPLSGSPLSAASVGTLW